MIVLAVDLGTTATKVVAVDARAKVVAATERTYPMRTSGLEAAHDPQQVLAAAFDAIRELASEDVEAIALTGAMHSIMGLDASLNPVTEALSWADNRAVEQTERLRGTAEGRELHRQTGAPIHSFTPLMKLAWWTNLQVGGSANRPSPTLKKLVALMYVPPPAESSMTAAIASKAERISGDVHGSSPATHES